MRTIRGQTIADKTVTDDILNIFTATLTDGRKAVFRQPRKWDTHEQRVAYKKISEENWRRYRRVNIEEQWLYDMKKRCQAPLYDGDFPGVLPLTIEVDGEVVGFCDIFFKYGREFPRFKVEDDEKCANGSIIALDKYHGHGIGYLYSEMSNFISKHFGCKTILGRTFVSKGMRDIRRKDGWEIVWTDGKLIDHKKTL